MNDEQRLQLLKHAVGFKIDPPTIDEFLDSKYYLGALGLTVYPFWRKRLRELYPNNITTASTYVCLYGCIGGGKSFFSEIVILYDICKMACAGENFMKYNGLSQTKDIKIKCSNIYKNKSGEFAAFLNDVVFGAKVPFFENELRRGNAFLTHLKIQAIGVKESDLRSDDVPTIWLSELTALKTEVGRSVIDSANSRLTSRYIDSENIFTHLILDSSTTGTDSALDYWLKNDPRAPSAFKVHVNSWNVTEGMGKYFNFGSFEVYCGDSKNNPFIIPKDFPEHKRRELDPDNFLTCPNELLPEAQRNIVLFLQEKAGISTNTTSKFFRDKDKVSQAFCLAKDYDDVVVMRFDDPTDTLMSKLSNAVAQLPYDRKLYIRIDCGVASDLFGLAIGYGDGIKRTNVDGVPTERIKIKIPIAVGISRYEGEETNISKVEDFILQLNQDREVALVMTDQYQSTELRQIMKQNGIEAKMESVDRDDSAYVVTKNYIYSGLVEIAQNALAEKELLEIERVGPRKVDHPPKSQGGSKDISDTISGVIRKLVELGPEVVLEPPSAQMSAEFTRVYDEINDYHSHRQIASHYSDYL